MLLVVVALFLLRATGMTAHIAVSVVGLVLLIVYTIATKKQWKCPAFEIVTRVFYAVALITGVEKYIKQLRNNRVICYEENMYNYDITDSMHNSQLLCSRGRRRNKYTFL